MTELLWKQMSLVRSWEKIALDKRPRKRWERNISGNQVSSSTRISPKIATDCSSIWLNTLNIGDYSFKTRLQRTTQIYSTTDHALGVNGTLYLRKNMELTDARYVVRFRHRVKANWHDTICRIWLFAWRMWCCPKGTDPVYDSLANVVVCPEDYVKQGRYFGYSTKIQNQPTTLGNKERNKLRKIMSPW